MARSSALMPLLTPATTADLGCDCAADSQL
jgi:hypothetical protein